MVNRLQIAMDYYKIKDNSIAQSALRTMSQDAMLCETVNDAVFGKPIDPNHIRRYELLAGILRDIYINSTAQPILSEEVNGVRVRSMDIKAIIPMITTNEVMVSKLVQSINNAINSLLEGKSILIKNEDSANEYLFANSSLIPAIKFLKVVSISLQDSIEAVNLNLPYEGYKITDYMEKSIETSNESDSPYKENKFKKILQRYWNMTEYINELILIARRPANKDEKTTALVKPPYI